MELKTKIQKYVNKWVARLMIITLTMLFVTILYVNDWKSGGYYFTCENPSPAKTPPSCTGYDEEGNEIIMFKGDVIGTPPHPLTKDLTIAFYSSIPLFIIINHMVYLYGTNIKHRKQ